MMCIFVILLITCMLDSFLAQTILARTSERSSFCSEITPKGEKMWHHVCSFFFVKFCVTLWYNLASSIFFFPLIISKVFYMIWSSFEWFKLRLDDKHGARWTVGPQFIVAHQHWRCFRPSPRCKPGQGVSLRNLTKIQKEFKYKRLLS